jgi:hypothetical protein
MSKGEFNTASTGITSGFPPAYLRHQHACLTLNRTDRLRLIRFPASIIDIVRQTILSSWPRGLKNEKPYAGSYEFKLNGNPWWGHAIESVESCTMMYVFIYLT